MKHWHYLAFACALLSGCTGSTVKETLGLTRSAPDEYRVVSRPPLSMPPQFNLRPPSATEPALGMVPASDQAAAALLGNPDSIRANTAVMPVELKAMGKEAPKLNAADSQFLQNAGAANANPKVREQLVEERYMRLEAKENASWWDALDWTSDKKDPMVDAKKEAERIRQNSDEGKPVTEGDTPEIKGRDTGLLGKIFDY